MLIKYQALEPTIKKRIFQLYIITGQDQYLMDDAQKKIQRDLKEKTHCDVSPCYITHTADWDKLLDASANLSLFAETTLIQAYYDKKSLDKAGQSALQHLLDTSNTQFALILMAPNLPIKQLQKISAQQQALVVQAYPLNETALYTWIVKNLQSHGISFTDQVPHLIHQHTQGNMLACAQTIEKIALTTEPGTKLTEKAVELHLIDQSSHTLFELADAFLLGQCDKSIHMVRQAENTKTEPTLLLWLITKEIRLLIQLHAQLNKNINISEACNHLKIWSSKIKLYHNACQRLPLSFLYSCLQYANTIDHLIKSNHSSNIWFSIERLIMSLTTSKRLHIDA